MSAAQRTILFLIADTGAGHRSAANAITHAIKLISQRDQEEWQKKQQAGQMPGGASPPPTYKIEIVDVFEEYSRWPLREAVKLYGPTIRYNPKLFGRVFHISNQNQTVQAVQTVATPLIHNGLIRLFTTIRPDVIVSIHPLLNHVTINAIHDLNIKVPFLTVVTDLISIHHSWYAPGADGYILPTEQAKQLYLERGMDPSKVQVLGMPIDPKFTFPVDDKAALQKRLGLQPGLPVVLLVGGGDGAGGLRSSIKAISQARLAVQLLIITGRNKRLYTHLQRTRQSLHVPTVIYGFVNNMPEMMHAADVIVTKAGPGTISEALSCDLPVILSGYVPGQEEGNVDYVLKNDVGVIARSPIELADTIRKLVKPGSQVMKRQLENARRISRPAASFDISRAIFGYLPPVGQPSPWENAQFTKLQRIQIGKIGSPLSLRGLRSDILPLKSLSALRRTARQHPLSASTLRRVRTPLRSISRAGHHQRSKAKKQ